MFSKLFLKYCSLALLINLQTSFLARLKVAQSTGLSEILAFFSSLSLFFMASLISVVIQFGWFLFFHSFLFHRYLRIKNDSKNLYQLSTISSVSSKALSHGASLNSSTNFWASRRFMSRSEKVLSHFCFAKSDLCSVEPPLLEGDPTFRYSLFVYTYENGSVVCQYFHGGN